MVFDSRQQAGKLLAEELRRRKIKPDVVFGLVRGGMAVAAEVAKILGVKLRPLVVRKIGAPGNPEFAVGAAAEIPGSQQVVVWWDEDTLKQVGVSEEWKREKVKKKQCEISTYREKLKNGSDGKDGLDGNILLVDDGAATGISMMAAIKGIREEGKGKKEEIKIIVALPVASTDAAAKIKQQADETVILSVDPDFRAVGQYYRRFEQVEWNQVRELLLQSKHDVISKSSRANFSERGDL